MGSIIRSGLLSKGYKRVSRNHEVSDTLFTARLERIMLCQDSDIDSCFIVIKSHRDFGNTLHVPRQTGVYFERFLAEDENLKDLNRAKF